MQKTGMGVREKYRKHFRDFFVRLASVQYVYLPKPIEFHDMHMECQRKIILIHFLLYYLF